jgi:hypothetical protein
MGRIRRKAEHEAGEWLLLLAVVGACALCGALASLWDGAPW